MRLPNDEWLLLAKGTAVGQKRRARHRSEGRENLVVGNEPDRWFAYCQSCRRGAVEMKSHVLVGGHAPSLSTDLSLPTDARPIMELQQYERDALTLLFARKSMDWMFFDGARLEWSASRQRLLVHTPSGVMGRDTTERSDQKWLTYNRQHYLAPLSPSINVVLVEDTFSYFKVHHALVRAGLDCAAICTLGTSIHGSLMLHLLRFYKRVWSFYDGDSAGWKGALANAKRLRAVGLQGPGDVLNACAPHGKDPKDMDLGAITAHVAALLSTSKELPT